MRLAVGGRQYQPQDWREKGYRLPKLRIWDHLLEVRIIIGCQEGNEIRKRGDILLKGNYKGDPVRSVTWEAEWRSTPVSALLLHSVLHHCLPLARTPESQRATESEECSSLRKGAESKRAYDQQVPKHIICSVSSMASPGSFFSVNAKIIILVICVIASIWILIRSLKIRAMRRGALKFHS